MTYWLVKTEPDVYSIADLQRDGSTEWTGVRNYQARNFLQAMKRGDKVLIYHSNAEPPGVVGVGVVARVAQPDTTQFDKKSEYYDAKASKEKPRWFAPLIAFEREFGRILALDELRGRKALEGLLLLQRGTRLSVIPVEEGHFKEIVGCAQKSAGKREAA
jgi:predicted RNA-binding protein with PUA-like domain